jgi:serine protease AprX
LRALAAAIWSTVLLVATAPAWAAAPASPLDVELRAALDQASASSRLAVIVEYRAAVDGHTLRAALAEATHEERRHAVVRQLTTQARERSARILAQAEAGKAEELRDLWIINAVALRAERALISQLAALPEVTRIRLDGVMLAPIAYPGLALPAEWNIALIDAPSLWSRGIKGQGAVIAILDSGVDPRHPELAARYRGGPNSWFDPNSQHPSPADVSGHGTQVAGILVGGESSGTHIGVAPEAQWIAAKIFDDAGLTSESIVHRALQWVLDPDGNPATDDAPDVVNNSWDIDTEDGCNTAFQVDVDALRAADIAVVFSAGNYGPAPSTSVSPANTARALSVGAVDDQLQVPLFSSRGPSACDGGLFPRLVAPGEGVLTTDLSFGGAPMYTLVAGTSFSAPHVAGAIALMRSAAPLASVAEIETALTSTARDIGAAGPDNDSGFGLINLPVALEALPLSDLDHDGYGAGRDCNDRNPAIHPGAPEKARDGKDQDCNGFDLTISVKYAVYSHDGSSLAIRATSRRGAVAALTIDGVGAMTWREAYGDFVFNGATTGVLEQFTISGAEGAVTVTPRRPTRRR